MMSGAGSAPSTSGPGTSTSSAGAGGGLTMWFCITVLAVHIQVTDQRARGWAFYFWPWRFNFFCRCVCVGGSYCYRHCCCYIVQVVWFCTTVLAVHIQVTDQRARGWAFHFWPCHFNFFCGCGARRGGGGGGLHKWGSWTSKQYMFMSQLSVLYRTTTSAAIITCLPTPYL
jgi:hypothetical protein